MAKIEVRPRKRVLVRAWGDRPSVLWLHAIDSNRLRAYVGTETGIRPLGLPSAQVFHYDTDALHRLQLEYDGGTPHALSSAWSDLEDLQ